MSKYFGKHSTALRDAASNYAHGFHGNQPTYDKEVLAFKAGAKWEREYNQSEELPDSTTQNSELLECLKGACQDFEDQIHATEKKLGGMISWVGPEWYNQARDLLRKQNLK